MRNKLICYALFLTSLFKTEKMISKNQRAASQLDLMSQLRPPYSLTEILHEGLINLETLLRSGFFQSENTTQQIFEQSEELLQALHASYDGMIDTSKIHAVYRDDRDFLQNLIDRIDSMIADLERSKDLSDQSLDLLRKNVNLLHDLKVKVRK